MQSIRHVGPAVALAGLLLASAPGAGLAQASGSYTLSGDRVAVYNLAGSVRIRGATGSEVGVEIDAHGKDAGSLRVETGPLGDRQALRVIYPDDRIVYPQLHRGSHSRIRVRDDGTFFDDRGRRGRQVEIRSRGRGLEAYADMVVSVPAGQRVRVYLGVGEVHAENVDGILVIDVAAAPVTTVSTRGALRVDTGSGSVEVQDAEGDVNIDTGSGRVEVAGVRSDRLRIDTGSGGVVGSDITADVLDVDTGSGRIDLAAVRTGGGRLDTGSGSVTLELLTDVGDLKIDTGSGKVTVYFPESLGAELNLEAGSGGIDINVPVTVRRLERDALHGILGDGRGTISVDTGSGSIRFIQR